jgi:riboflavin synthase
VFTGIVQHVGSTRSLERVDFGVRLAVDRSGWAHAPASGESIAVSGVCLTVAEVERGGDCVRFDVVRQTLAATTLGDLEPGDPVNLEHAVTPSTLLGGHIVQGHVDGIGVVRAVERSEREHRVRIEPPAPLLDYLVDRGSIAVDGVSLTIAAIDGASFEVALIPVTLARTTLGRAVAGTRVNLEADCIVKTVVRWLNERGVSALSRARDS